MALSGCSQVQQYLQQQQHLPDFPQQYCLRWNNHQHNLLNVFEELLNSEALVDMTLACDGLQMKAHKMVLSACSPYFQAMLNNTPDRHPIVFLRDVKYCEMKALLEFMYRGEVSVDQENLTSLLKVAEGLKIKGLAEVSESAAEMSKSSPSPRPCGSSASASSSASSYKPKLSFASHPLQIPDVHSRLSSDLASPLSLSMRDSSLASPPGAGLPFPAGARRKRARPCRRLSGSSEAAEVAAAETEASSQALPGKREHAAMKQSLSDESITRSEKASSSTNGTGALPSSATTEVSCEPDVRQILIGGAASSSSCSSPESGVHFLTAAARQQFAEHKPARPHKKRKLLTEGSSEEASFSAPEPHAIKTEVSDEDEGEDDGELGLASSSQGDSSVVLDYVLGEDGRCECKLCGEVLASRTHWYRHKYKVHNASLFRCDKCELFFKSKKGYEGHLQNRHMPKLVGSDGKPKSRKEMEGLNKVLKEIQSRKEAELVQKIIAQVKAECEAKGADLDRRGYTKHY